MTAEGVDRSLGARSRFAARHATALVAAGTIAAFLELRVADLDHGTHLLVVLTLVITAALLLGPGPGVFALAVGGAISTVASVLTIDGALHTPHAYVQLLAYLLAGSAFIVLMALLVRARRAATHPIAAPWALAPSGHGLVERLTARECEVLRLAATGISVDEIASRLFVSPNTVKTHLTHVYAKLGVRGRSEAIRAALHCGCLTPADICPHLAVSGMEESPVPVTTLRPTPSTIE